MNPFYEGDVFKDEAYDGEMIYGWSSTWMTNPNLNRGGKFSFANYDRRRDCPSPNQYRMKVEISSFSGNLDIESFLD